MKNMRVRVLALVLCFLGFAALLSFGQGTPPQSTTDYGTAIQLMTQYTNSTTTFTNVAGGNTMQFTAAPNTNYTMTCHLYYQAASSGGLDIKFTGPASPTNVVYGIYLPTSASVSANGVASAFNSPLGTGVVTANANFDAVVSFALQNGNNSGTVNLLAASISAVQLQIQAGSYCKWQISVRNPFVSIDHD